jgi:uncharacterized protein YjbI with pentapeptide repeats
MVNKKVLITIHENLYSKLKMEARLTKRSISNFIEVKLQGMCPESIPQKIDLSKHSPKYEVLDISILNQYRMDCSNTLSYGERRQLTKLHKGLLEQKLKGYSIIKYFYFPNVDLSNRDLSNITFKDGNLSYGNFKNSNLTNCDFTKTSLREADFTGANLENAKLNINYISNFKCNPINFTGANLKGTILENNN